MQDRSRLWLHSILKPTRVGQAGWTVTRCAGVGLRNIEPAPDRPRILIPNAGDLSAGGSNVAIRLASDGMISFIPLVYVASASRAKNVIVSQSETGYII